MVEIERFEDYAVVVQPRTHNLHFEVRQIVGDTADPPVGQWLYRRADNGITTEFEEGEPFLSGDVKWDGCSNWNFHDDVVMIHFCRRDQGAGVGRLLDHLYQITKERLETYEGD